MLSPWFFPWLAVNIHALAQRSLLLIVKLRHSPWLPSHSGSQHPLVFWSEHLLLCVVMTILCMHSLVTSLTALLDSVLHITLPPAPRTEPGNNVGSKHCYQMNKWISGKGNDEEVSLLLSRFIALWGIISTWINFYSFIPVFMWRAVVGTMEECLGRRTWLSQDASTLGGPGQSETTFYFTFVSFS